MSDLGKLLFNEIEEALSVLSNNGVGFINQETSDAIQYQIDGRRFDIIITEVSHE